MSSLHFFHRFHGTQHNDLASVNRVKVVVAVRRECQSCKSVSRRSRRQGRGQPAAGRTRLGDSLLSVFIHRRDRCQRILCLEGDQSYRGKIASLPTAIPVSSLYDHEYVNCVDRHRDVTIFSVFSRQLFILRNYGRGLFLVISLIYSKLYVHAIKKYLVL